MCAAVDLRRQDGIWPTHEFVAGRRVARYDYVSRKANVLPPYAPQDELRYMAEWSARMDAQEAARSAQLQRVAAIQAAQAQEAQVERLIYELRLCYNSRRRNKPATSRTRSARLGLRHTMLMPGQTAELDRQAAPAVQAFAVSLQSSSGWRRLSRRRARSRSGGSTPPSSSATSRSTRPRRMPRRRDERRPMPQAEKPSGTPCMGLI